MTNYFLGVLISEQLLDAAIQYTIFGEIFKWWGDSVVFMSLAIAYLYFSNALGEFLLDLHLNGEEINK
jgi:hypothetical protein